MYENLTQYLATLVADPAIDAVARAARAKLPGRPYIEPVAVLKHAATIRVVVRVSPSRPQGRNTSNRFEILDDQGKPAFFGPPICGLSTTAAILRHDGWAAAEVSAAEVATRKTTARLAALLYDPILKTSPELS